MSHHTASPPQPPFDQRPRNGYRRAAAIILAAVSLTVLAYAAILILIADIAISRDRAIVLAVFLGLHTFALTILTGDSPWPHILKLLARQPATDDDHQPAP
jgi:hypothetical protein